MLHTGIIAFPNGKKITNSSKGNLFLQVLFKQISKREGDYKTEVLFQTYFFWRSHKHIANSAPIYMQLCIRDSSSLRRNWIEIQGTHSSTGSAE